MVGPCARLVVLESLSDEVKSLGDEMEGTWVGMVGASARLLTARGDDGY